MPAENTAPTPCRHIPYNPADAQMKQTRSLQYIHTRVKHQLHNQGVSEALSSLQQLPPALHQPKLSYRCSMVMYEKYGILATVSRNQKRCMGLLSKAMSRKTHRERYTPRTSHGVSTPPPAASRADSRSHTALLLSFNSSSLLRICTKAAQMQHWQGHAGLSALPS